MFGHAYLQLSDQLKLQCHEAVTELVHVVVELLELKPLLVWVRNLLHLCYCLQHRHINLYNNRQFLDLSA